jgi:ABC-type transporter Mla MlaB component
MPSTSTMMVESHRSAATLYATGDLTTAGVLQAVAHIEGLPEQVRALCIDLRGVRRADSHAMRALEAALRDWRAARRGMSRVKLAEDVDTSLVAIKFAHQRWTPPTPHYVPPPRERFGGRIRDYRQAVVTRSLRERAGSETR